MAAILSRPQCVNCTNIKCYQGINNYWHTKAWTKLSTFCRRMLQTLQWRHNGHDSVSNHQPYDCLLNRLFRRRSKKPSMLCVTGLCAGNSPGTGEFPAQMASNAKNVSIWWRHHDVSRLENNFVLQFKCTVVFFEGPNWKYVITDSGDEWLDDEPMMTQFTYPYMRHQGPLLLRWFNFNPSMDK